MSAPTLEKLPAASPPAPRPRRRPLLLLIAAALAVTATAAGVSLAVATRPAAPQAPVVGGPGPVVDRADPGDGTGTRQSPKPDTPGDPQPVADSGSGGSTGPAAVLADGTHQAYITKVDSGNDRIVVDVVQVFHDRDAVEAAVADGEPRDTAQYRTTWVRNQSSRLRTLPLAGDLRVQLYGVCGEPSDDREAVLAKLARHAGPDGTFYYTLTVSGGAVHKIQERLAINAC
jgi:hypothetical protein